MDFKKTELNALPFAFAKISKKKGKPNGQVTFRNTFFANLFFDGVPWTDKARRSFARKINGKSPLGPLREGLPSQQDLKSAGGVDYFRPWDAPLDSKPTHHIIYPNVLRESFLRDIRNLPGWRRQFRFHLIEGGRKFAVWVDEITREIETQLEIEASNKAGDRLIRVVQRGLDAVPGVAYAITQRRGALGGDFYFHRWSRDGRYLVVLIGDSAGDGVPAALTSLIAGVKLAELCQLQNLGELLSLGYKDDSGNLASRMLDELDDYLVDTFQPVEKGQNPGIGLDGIACVFDYETSEFHYAEGNFQVWRVRGGQIDVLGHMASEGQQVADEEEDARVQRNSGKTIGAGWELEFEYGTAEFRPGDLLVSASDGVFNQLGPGENGELVRYGKRSFERDLKEILAGFGETDLTAFETGRTEVVSDLVEALSERVTNHLTSRQDGSRVARGDDQLIYAMILPEASSSADGESIASG